MQPDMNDTVNLNINNLDESYDGDSNVGQSLSKYDTEHADQPQFANGFFETINPSELRVATRTISKRKISVSPEFNLIYQEESTEYRVPYTWDRQFLRQALIYNVLTDGIIQFGITCIHSAEVTCEDAKFDIPAEAWEGWAQLVDEVTMTVSVKNKKTKEKIKRTISVAERVVKLLNEVRDTLPQLTSLVSRKRSLEQVTVTPHAVTGEFTAGSTAERIAVDKDIENITLANNDRIANINALIEKLNEHIGIEDTQWQVSLPETIREITVYNEPYPKDAFDPNLLY